MKNPQDRRLYQRLQEIKTDAPAMAASKAKAKDQNWTLSIRRNEMFSEEKINAVKECLKSEFPDHSLHDHFDSDREAQTFRLLQDQNSELKIVTVAREFIEDHTADEILVILNRMQLSECFRKDKDKNRMIIASKGITFE